MSIVSLVRPKRGLRFEHKTWLTITRQNEHVPAVCIITAVRRGEIYYKFEGDKRASFRFPIADMEKRIGKWL